MSKEELERPALEFDKRRRSIMRLAETEDAVKTENEPATADDDTDTQEYDKAA